VASPSRVRWPRERRRFFFATTLIALLIAALVGTGFLVDHRFRRLTPDPLPDSQGTRVWAHYVDTLEELERRTNGGFSGIELDIHYVGASGFLVAHDAPGPENRLSPEEYFARDNGRLSYWLDFKNLTNGNVNGAIAAFERLFARYPVRERVMIESDHAAALARLRNALSGVKVIYWVRGYPARLRNALLRAEIRWRVGWFGFRNVSTVDHGDLDAFLRDFGHLGMYISTINSPTRMTALRDAGAQTILTDLDAVPPGFRR
jgi:glycerophosphoryl diester phosphodiesterase